MTIFPAPKTALICGISGQDGAYLAQLLLSKNYTVYGTSRDAQMANLDNLTRLGIHQRVKLVSMAPNDFRSVLQALKRVHPDEIYNLAGQTSVGLSFEQPVESIESITLGTLNLLEAIRFMGGHMKLFNAGSTECFGETGDSVADENTPFRPRSPYAVAKAAAFWEVANYREAYHLFACSAILANHDSPLRPKRFVTQKIVMTACQIAQGYADKLYLGNVSILRDWGWAPEYVEAMYLLLQQDQPEDFIIATGETYPLAEFIAQVFHCLNLNYQDYVVTDSTLFRPTDIAVSRVNPQKANLKLKWQAKHKMHSVAQMMVEAAYKTSVN